MEHEYGGDEIAVVGLAGRFPAAPDVPTLWRNLLDGVDAVHDHTDEELRALGVAESLIADPALVRGHGRLAGVADFDAEFFDVPASEARAMDPQQRLFLEQSWVALQDAAVDPTDPERAIGVFAGASANRYFLFRLLARQAGEDWEELLATRWAADYLPAQVAYRLGLTGPAVAVQTACSSSLVAVCTAAQSLADFRCDVALAGGVSVTEPRFRHTPGGLVSPDGRCRAFDAAGQGSGYGSGVAVVALERLADALERGAQVYGVLRGWAVNNDGSARAGFAVPGLDGQVAVVTEALACNSLSGADIGYVEAHGSGTPVGDAIEVAALTQAFGASAGSCALGSVKTNLGNLDAAAGVTGLIKAVLAVRNATIPATLHHDVPNPEIDFAAGPFFVPVKTTEWNRPDRVAGVSSFGLGGTNAHVIVEQPPVDDPREEPSGPQTLVVSARTPEALRLLAARLSAHLATEAGLRLDDVAHTLASRQRYAFRAASACDDIPSAIAWLDRVAAGGDSAGEDSADQDNAGEDSAGPDVSRTPGSAGRVVSLPHHPLQPRRHWIEVSS
ncbi:beta-ketoacyl synthase N-terminal-like domain-containing protein [Actinosynnema sp. CS-041913]|uniref:beta-ketoacyl synthase N-terminal-like domain-containing protein n=1 Tax=Actinosynnema sp. CS-041913 TaxID=3239917 RepID=UPI003D90D029